MSTAYSGQNIHQRERTQLFQNVGPYNPAQMMRAETPTRYRTDSPAYSDSVLQSIESQNDEKIDGLTAKIRILKDISSKIGEEVKDSTNLLANMEEGFDNARLKVKNTMNRLIQTSREHGIGWRAWLGFFVFIWFCFFIVWLL